MGTLCPMSPRCAVFLHLSCKQGWRRMEEGAVDAGESLDPWWSTSTTPQLGFQPSGAWPGRWAGQRQGVVNAVGVVGWGGVSGRGLGRGRGIDTHLTAICLTLASFLTLCCHLVAWCGRAPSRSHLWSCRVGCTSLAGTEVVTQVHRDGECWGEICRPKGPGRPFTQTGTGLTDGHIATWVGGPGLLPLLAMRETEACEAMVVLP
jgi:hypothetical protein